MLIINEDVDCETEVVGGCGDAMNSLIVPVHISVAKVVCGGDLNRLLVCAWFCLLLLLLLRLLGLGHSLVILREVPQDLEFAYCLALLATVSLDREAAS